MLRTICILRLMSFNVQSQAAFQKYSSKAENMKKLMKEYKLVFGKLIETKSQKKKRLKLEKKGKIPQEKVNEEDTELFWVSQNCHKNLKRLVVLTNSQDQSLREKPIAKSKKNIISEENETAQEIGDEISNPTCDLSIETKDINNKSIFVTKTSYDRQNVFKEDSNSDVSLLNSSIKSTSDNIDQHSIIKNTNAKYNVQHSNFERLPDIIIKNLPFFSIMSNKQESFTESTEVLTISGLDYPKTLKFPSVTKILTHTMSLESKLALEAWKAKMIEKLGHDGFQAHQKALLEDGASLHSCIAQNMLGKEFEIPSRIEPVFKSVQSVLKDIQHVKAIETYVAHTKLHYKGIVDCVASYRGENYVIDWKKSDKKKLNLKQTYDGPVQVAAYIGAINASDIYPFVIKRGLLVIAYTCGAPATVYEICDNTLQQYWTMWLHRLQKYHVEMANNDNNENVCQ